jgi:hypothetical protein
MPRIGLSVFTAQVRTVPIRIADIRQDKELGESALGVPPTFRTADPLGIFVGKDRNYGG